MKKRDRDIPPPPPPPGPSLPAYRPRRLDVTNFNFRNDPRALPKPPAPPSEWPESDVDSYDHRPSPSPPPEPPENLGDVLRDLTKKYAAPLARSAGPRREPTQPADREDSAKFLNVPLVCTKTDQPFVVAFREMQSASGVRYYLDRTLTALGEDGAAAASVTVPITSLSWGGIKCPHCQSRCSPIHCGRCGRLACDGKVSKSEKGLFFECAPSCGKSGYVHDSLETVTGSESDPSPPPSMAGGLIRAPAAPPAKPLGLPKPR